MKSTAKRVTVGAALGGALFLSAGTGVATADPRDGQVDIALGTAGVLEDVPIGAASQLAAAVCDVEVNQVQPVAETVDADGVQKNVCASTVGAVDFRQNEADEPEATADQQDDAADDTGNAEETAPAEETETTPTTEAPTGETG
ncbi:hypothetical protein [Mycobacterium hubeiense]|uniref:hypothetical protein n=1 Tax=Mycobacterium hubeiense TaxID=1867256 RepID=UPI000C7F6EF6|nr:hypothetical protein [Mycobacterium sp. QGD 101]